MAAPKNKVKKGRVAVCIFRGRICPRFDIPHEILIFDAGSALQAPPERIDISPLSDDERVNLLVQSGVRELIVGGIPEKLLQLLDHHRIKVIWGIIGKVEEAIEAYRRGSLQSGAGVILAPRGPWPG